MVPAFLHALAQQGQFLERFPSSVFPRPTISSPIKILRCGGTLPGGVNARYFCMTALASGSIPSPTMSDVAYRFGVARLAIRRREPRHGRPEPRRAWRNRIPGSEYPLEIETSRNHEFACRVWPSAWWNSAKLTDRQRRSVPLDYAQRELALCWRSPHRHSSRPGSRDRVATRQRRKRLPCDCLSPRAVRSLVGNTGEPGRVFLR